jgi:hypothetical protein
MKTIRACAALLLFGIVLWMILSLVLVVSLAHCGENKKSDWTYTDTALQATFLTLHGMDWAQTLHIVRNPDKYYETNNILGKYPSEGRVNSYMALTAIGHTAIAYALPKPWRTMWQGTGIYIGYDSVQHNINAGIGISFHF